MATGAIVELHRNSGDWDKIVAEIVKLERKIFPKHESLATFFDQELRKKNSGLLYLDINGEIVGYVLYSWPSSLYASITKLAVKEQWRRQGHGEILLKAAIEKCRTRKVSRILLHVDPMRTPALTLYRKQGFQDWNVNIAHVYREGNCCADFLATHALTLSVGLHDLEEPPDGLRRLIREDAEGAAHERLCSSLD